jgi:hypothetical protein
MWRAEVQRFRRGGVELVTVRGDDEVARVWFPSVIAAVSSMQGKQFEWREAGAIGSPTLYRGELGPWPDAGWGA